MAKKSQRRSTRKAKPSAKGKTGKSAVLHLTLHREFFDDIAAGKKKTEFRDNTPYWRARLLDRQYDEIHFRNGYASRAPFMRVKWLGTRKITPRTFAIRLGRIIKIANYKPG